MAQTFRQNLLAPMTSKTIEQRLAIQQMVTQSPATSFYKVPKAHCRRLEAKGKVARPERLESNCSCCFND